ncbi:MAG: glycosyltransferase family 4 protein [Euryarchaeota archaeon]|nr:glycosyltransferase family 4 protein [Euryarchaeota archaeon]
MKIAYVYDVIYPYVIGGAEKRVWEISKRLAKNGHEVHIFGMKYWDGGAVLMKEGVYLHGVGKPKELYVDGRRSIHFAISFATKLLPSLIKEDYDIIDSQEFSYLPCFSAKICSSVKRVPLIITWYEVWDDYWYEYLGKLGIFGKVIEKMTTYLTSDMIAISERTKRDLEQIGVKNEIKIIPNGIDFEQIERVKASEKESDVIFAGRLIKEKNVDVLIAAVKLIKKDVPAVKSIIIGDGPEKRKLEQLVCDLGLENNIEFTGFLNDHDDVISYMKSSKVLLLPSTREGFGIVALEANACGLPAITVDHKMNATCDFINNDRNGFICELSEYDVAAKILMGLEKGKGMEKKCIESAMGYDWARISKLTESIYEEVIT